MPSHLPNPFLFDAKSTTEMRELGRIAIFSEWLQPFEFVLNEVFHGVSVRAVRFDPKSWAARLTDHMLILIGQAVARRDHYARYAFAEILRLKVKCPPAHIEMFVKMWEANLDALSHGRGMPGMSEKENA